MCTFDPQFPNYPFPGFFLSVCIINSQFTYNNNYYYTVAIVKKTRKNEQTGLNMDVTLLGKYNSKMGSALWLG